MGAKSVLAGLAAALWATSALAVDLPADQRRIFEDHGGTTALVQEKDGTVWLTLWEPHIRYRVEKQPPDKLERLGFLLTQADERSRSVQVRYDGGKGRLNRATGTLDYPLCAIVLDDLVFEPSRPCEDKPPARPKTMESSLTLARAQMSAGNFVAAHDLLAGVQMPADAAARKLLLQVRAQNEAELGAAAEGGRGDRALAESLADYFALAKLDPDNVEHRFEIAQTYIELGGYAEARAVYDAILQKWPGEEFRVAIRIGALHRAQGEYEAALKALNDLVAKNGPQAGMRFHYHRGWTLTLLGRHDEAIRDLTEGLETQPDYSAAYLRRACARASVGQLEEALADVDQAAKLIAALPGAETIKLLRADRDEAAAMRVRIEAALKAGDGKPVPGTCGGPMWERYEHPRERSPMLPAA